MLHFDPRPDAVADYRRKIGLMPSLVRKRCICGVQVTAKQLKQYGACVKCVRKVSA